MGNYIASVSDMLFATGITGTTAKVGKERV